MHPIFHSFFSDSSPLPRKPFLLVIGPYHRIAKAQDGWISRVRTMDAIFSKFDRIYVNFSVTGKLFFKGKRKITYSVSPHISQYNLDSKNPEHMHFFQKIAEKASACYVHNLHLAAIVLPQLQSDKMIIDMHGAIPEEEALLGNPEKANALEEVEKELLSLSTTLVVVSEALAKHLKKKHPATTCNFIHVPICESLPQNSLRTPPFGKLRLVYCGSNHLWQNVPQMLGLFQKHREKFLFSIYSHNFLVIQEMAKSENLDRDIKFASVSKEKLPSVYSQADLGFILRDANVVNQVSCPTKLYEYLHLGVVPVVRTPQLGDFPDYGYQFLTESDLDLPDSDIRKKIANIIPENQKAASKLRHDFAIGTEKLLAHLHTLLA